MNYLKEILAFNDLVDIKEFSTGQIALWYALIYTNNKCAWNDTFTVSNKTLELRTGLSRGGILKARNALKQHGLIDFKINNTKATTYKLNTIANSEQASEQASEQVSDTLNKHKTINKKDNAKALSKKDAEKLFEQFWQAYPHKIAKAAASKKFTLLCQQNGFDYINNINDKAAAYSAWCKKNGQEIKYIPHPSTWLNQERWNDVLVDRQTPKSSIINNTQTSYNLVYSKNREVM